MKIYFFLVFIFLFQTSWSAQKAKIVSPQSDIYSAADFDSDVLGSVKGGESYMISSKVYGPFFRIQMKSGKIGYIPDTEVYIEGKGLAVPEGGDVEEDPFLNDMEDPPETINKTKNKKSKKFQEDDDQVLKGLTLQLVNYHEDTLGAVQVDDLPAIGYKYLSDLTWEVLLSFKTPKYYSDKLQATVKSYNLWADFGISNDVPLSPVFSGRYGAGLFSHLSIVKVETVAKTYDMQDLTVGAYLEGAMLIKFEKLSYDFSLKYLFDRQSYGVLGFTVFF